MKRRKKFWRGDYIWVLLILTSLGMGQVRAANLLQKAEDWITFYGAAGQERGIWLYDPLAQELELLTDGIGDRYKFSSDGRYLAFLSNNHDRGQGKVNTISLWVKDLQEGTERAVDSEFDTDSNLDAEFDWLRTGELVVIQPTLVGDRQIKLYSPTGELVWANPEDSQYICHNDQSILLGERPDQNLTLYRLALGTYELIPVQGLVLNGSLSPKGTYFSYQTFKEIIVINLHNGEQTYIDVGEVNGVEFDWSEGESYLIYQVKKRREGGASFDLNVFNVETSIKEFEVSSQEKIPYSWSDDEEQMAFALFKNSWNLFVWFPHQYRTTTIQRRLTLSPDPMFRQGSDEFIFRDEMDGMPVVRGYDLEQNMLREILAGPKGANWSKLDLVPAGDYQRMVEKDQMYWAGWSEVKEIKYLRPVTGVTLGQITDQRIARRYHQMLKWAPKSRMLLWKEDGETLSLIDQYGIKEVIYQGDRIGEPYWSQSGGVVGFVSQGAEAGQELILYNIFKGQAYSYALPGKEQLVGWVENDLWFFDGRLKGYYPLGGEWQVLDGWRDFWWSKPEIRPAHYRAETLWQLGGNIWLNSGEGQFQILTRFDDRVDRGWQVEEIVSPRWSPDDEEVVYLRYLVCGEEEQESAAEESTLPKGKWQIWVMDHQGQGDRYIGEGVDAQWWGNHQLLFLRNGDLHLANLVTGQIFGYQTPELWEQAFMFSYDGSILAVVAVDQEENVGLYYYSLQ